jgi:dihydroorotase
MTTSITLPSACDFHLHLRQGDMMRMVTPKVEEGGVSLAYIMVKYFPDLPKKKRESNTLYALAQLTTSY